jgi:hypothetical protein
MAVQFNDHSVLVFPNPILPALLVLCVSCNLKITLQDHLMFPATEMNSTNQPKMSFLLPAPSGGTCAHNIKHSHLPSVVVIIHWLIFILNHKLTIPLFTDAKWRVKKNYIPMVKMDCQLTDSKRIFIKRSSIPPNLMDMSYLYTPFVNSDDRNWIAKRNKLVVCICMFCDVVLFTLTPTFAVFI